MECTINWLLDVKQEVNSDGKITKVKVTYGSIYTLKGEKSSNMVQFWHQSPCMGDFPSAPAGCPTIQLNSDIIYLETASGPTGWGLNPTRPPPAKGQSQTQIITHAPDCYRSEIPMTASWVWWGLTELRITPHILDCWFIIKDYNLGRVRWKRQARQSRWGEASASMAPATHPTSPSVAMQELSEPHSFGFSWRPHYISTIKS